MNQKHNSVKLSIITVTLNKLEGLKKTMNSVIGQDFKNIEHLIIDGGSTDGSHTFIEEQSGRLSFWVSEPDKGIYNAMNKGILKANGEYCLFLNSGDELIDTGILSDVFKLQPTADILYGNLRVEKGGEYIGHATTPSKITFKTLYEGTIHHQAAFIKRSLFTSLGLYNETYKIRADWEFWIRTLILNNRTSYYLGRIISIYEAEGISTHAEAQEQSKQETAEILRKYLPEKVLADYQSFEAFQKEMQVLKWAYKKRPLKALINLAYRKTSQYSKWKKLRK